MSSLSDNYFVMIGRSPNKKAWLFPETNSCPNGHCSTVNKSRKAAMIHFQERHAKDAILCEVCNKPIAQKRHFFNHFLNMHPKNPLPKFISESVSIYVRNSRVSTLVDSLVTLSFTKIIELK